MTNDMNYTLSVTHPHTLLLPSDHAQVSKVVSSRQAVHVLTPLFRFLSLVKHSMPCLNCKWYIINLCRTQFGQSLQTYWWHLLVTGSQLFIMVVWQQTRSLRDSIFGSHPLFISAIASKSLRNCHLSEDRNSVRKYPQQVFIFCRFAGHPDQRGSRDTLSEDSSTSLYV
jgi:hypothetical protein